MSASHGLLLSAGIIMTDPYTRLAANIIFPIHERLKGHDTVRVHRWLEETQWWSREELENLQLARLRELLRQSYRYVPYFQRILDETGMVGGEIDSLDDLHKIPYLTKSQIRANSHDLKSRRAQSLSRFNTGGSSGEPLIFWIGKERVSHDVAAKWRATRWWGVDIGDPEVVVWGSPIELGSQDRLRILRDMILRTHLLPAFEMSERKLDEFIDALQALRPRMIFGYPSSIGLIAQHAAKRGRRLDNLGTVVVFVTSERLYDHQRVLIEQTFSCPVANGYGGRDAGFIAHQCPAGGMHITAEDIIVEIIDGEGKVLPPGKEGEVVITHLATRDFPFIRYRTGDVAVLDERPCACGRGLPILKEIRGRTTDFVMATDGTIMHGLALIYVIRDIPGVENFRVIQETMYETRVQLVTGADFRAESLQLIERGMQQRLGSDVRVSIERMAHIPRESSGKYRYVVSHVTAVNH
jgi:phenylacetate-CoA ligase